MRTYKDKFFGNGNYPMPNVDAKYFKNVKSLNLEDLKTKYLMAFIIDWSKDADYSETSVHALKYMNGKYWIRNNYNAYVYNDEDWKERYDGKQTWKPITRNDLEGYYSIDGVIEENSDAGEGRDIFVIPYFAKGLHGYKTSTPNRKTPSNKCPVKVDFRKML